MFGLCFVVRYLVCFSSFAIILMTKRAGCFSLIVFLVSCDCWCSVNLPHDAMGWSAVCGCGIS